MLFPMWRKHDYPLMNVVQSTFQAWLEMHHDADVRRILAPPAREVFELYWQPLVLC